MSKDYQITRRAGLALIAGGVTLTATETLGVTSVTGLRGARVGVADDASAYLSIEPVLEDGQNVPDDGNEVVRITNRTNVDLTTLDVDVTIGVGLQLEDGGGFDNELASGESTTLSVSCPRPPQGAGITPVTVDILSAAGDGIEITDVSRTFDILQDCGGGGGDPFFDVAITNTNSPVDEGETLDVEATVQNTGLDEVTQDVTLTIGGGQRDSQTLTLTGGEEQTITLSWTDTVAGSYDATVASDDDSDTVGVSVVEPGAPFFDVTITGTNSPVEAGETVEVDATIENTGNGPGTQEIVFSVEGTVEATTQVGELSVGASDNLTFTYESDDDDVPEISVEAASDDDSDSATVEVDDGFIYIIQSMSASGNGNWIDVEVNIETNNPDSELEIRVMSGETEEGSDTINPAESGTYEVSGGAQADRVEVDLLDGDGNVRDSATDPI